MKRYLGLIMITLMSCSHTSGHDVQCTNNHKELSFSLVDTLQMDTSYPFSFNDFTSVKTSPDLQTVYVTNEHQKSIIGFDIGSENQVYSYNYDVLEFPIEDFYVTKKYYI